MYKFIEYNNKEILHFSSHIDATNTKEVFEINASPI